MRDESSPFFDPALRGFVAGLAGAMVALTTYYARNASRIGAWSDLRELSIEVVSFAAVMGAAIAGGVGLAQRRLGFTAGVMLVCSLIGPVAVAFASWRFGSYPIPFVDGFVVGGGLGTTFLLLARSVRPSIPFGLAALRLALFATPIASLAAVTSYSLKPWVIEHHGELMAIGPMALGAFAGLILGPTCGVWLVLALREPSAEPIADPPAEASVSVG